MYVCMYIYIYTHEWNINHKKDKILLFTAMCMDLENIMLSEISDKDKYI